MEAWKHGSMEAWKHGSKQDTIRNKRAAEVIVGVNIVDFVFLLLLPLSLFLYRPLLLLLLLILRLLLVNRTLSESQAALRPRRASKSSRQAGANTTAAAACFQAEVTHSQALRKKQRGEKQKGCEKACPHFIHKMVCVNTAVGFWRSV